MKKLIPYFKNKYLITTVVFVVWIAFFDRNDFFSQYTHRQDLKKLEREKQFFTEEIQKSRTDLQELMTNPQNLEKFAREKYLMKRDNEDIFVIVKEKH